MVNVAVMQTLKAHEWEKLLQSVEEIYDGAIEELKRASKEGKPTLIRDACEKGWLAVVEATNAFFLKRGLEPAESHKERREKLWKLEAEDDAVRTLGFYDRVNARAFSLHVQGFYEGALDEESVRRELEKVRRYIDEVKKL